MDTAEDWDLHAVVRGCTAAVTAATTTTCCSSSAPLPTSTTAIAAATTAIAAATTTPTSFLEPPQLEETFFGLQDLFFEQRVAGAGAGAAELHDLFKPFYTVSPPPPPQQNIPISPLSVLGGMQDLAQKTVKNEPQQQLQVYQPKQSTKNGPLRTKRRKNQLKKVCQVPAEGLSSDSWSWRKYGQKPIKGSPYPRGYYRCSTSKNCMARKQVERNRSDPGMFIITYTSEHNHPMPTHRNSLAGSTRNKPSTSQPAISGEPRKPSASPPVSPSASLSSAPGKLEVESSKEEVIGEEDDDGAVNGYEMEIDDEFFTGLEEIAMSGENDLMSLQFPWLSSSGAAAAAGGGDG